MPPSDIISAIAKTNKVSIGFFVVTCVLLGYEFYLYIKDKNGNKKPSIPLFKKGGNEPLSTHTLKPVPTPPIHTGAKPNVAPIPPLISQMSPPNMKHSPIMGRKKRKMSRGAKVTIGVTTALAVLTIGIAWKLNQPSSQRAGLTSQNAKASEQLTPGVSVSPAEGSGSAVTAVYPSPGISTTTGRALIPTITPRSDVIDLTSGKTTGTGDNFGGVATASALTTTDDSVGTSSADIAVLPMTGGTATEEATLAPTLPIAGTIQYSIGLLVVATVIVLASLIF